jgi:Ca-activated chloride channel family protein
VSFQSPLVLICLIAVPALALAYVLWERHRRASAARFSSLALLPNLLERIPGSRRHLPIALLLAALAAMIVGVARPHATVTVSRKEATIILAMDVSRSMSATDIRPSRLQASRSAANAFVAKVPKEFRIGLVSIGSNAVVSLPPTTERSLVAAALRAQRRSEGTTLGDGVALASELARRQRTSDGTAIPAAIVVISDGANQGGRTAPQAAAERARSLHIPVYTVLVGTAEGVVERKLTGGFTERIRVPASPDTLRLMSRASGGEFFQAATEQRLRDVYERLGTRLGHRKKSREVTDLFAAGSAVLLLAGGALSSLWFRRLP